MLSCRPACGATEEWVASSTQRSAVNAAEGVACPPATVPPAFQYLFTSGMEWSRKRLSINNRLMQFDYWLQKKFESSIVSWKDGELIGVMPWKLKQQKSVSVA